MGSEYKKEVFLNALKGKKIPILTLDNKWYRLLDEKGQTKAGQLIEELNELLRRQGKLNTGLKDIKRLKKKMMGEIVPLVSEVEQKGGADLEKKIEAYKRLIGECNEKIMDYEDELLELPKEIDRVNFQLMLLTMEYCYDAMRQNSRDIREISDWVTQARIDLKKKINS